MEARTTSRAPALVWDWTAALLCAVYALPAALAALDDPKHGVALAVGVLPAAILGLAPTRRGRVAAGVVAALTGVSMFIGGLLSGTPVLAVAAIVALGVASAALAARSRAGILAMNLALPLVGIGLSFTTGDAAAAAGLIVAGSIYALLVSLFWPLHPPRPGAAPSTPPAPTLGYGLRLGLAGATAAAIGFIFDLDHVGWACAAALLVMRPAAEMQRLRSVGRILSVAAGAFAAIAVINAAPPAGVYAAAIVAALAAAGATHRSRWYVTPGFTTFLVFLLLLYGNAGDAQWRLGERLGETVLGVALAYLFGLVLVRPGRRPAKRPSAPAADAPPPGARS